MKSAIKSDPIVNLQNQIKQNISSTLGYVIFHDETLIENSFYNQQNQYILMLCLNIIPRF